jgi:hypothetical protein
MCPYRTVYHYQDDDTSVIYASSSRKIYSRPILRLIQLSAFTHGQIDIFADYDPDFDTNWYREHLNRYLDSYDIIIYLNTEEKDFGNMPKSGEKFNYKAINI